LICHVIANLPADERTVRFLHEHCLPRFRPGEVNFRRIEGEVSGGDSHETA
jgi:hypothetical protein